MAQAGKFVLNKATIAAIAKNDPDLAAAVDKAAEQVKRETSGKGSIHTYTTDRHVAGIVVRAIEQAKHGVLTKALGIAGGHLGHRHD